MPAAQKKLRAVEIAEDTADTVAAKVADTSKAIRQDLNSTAQSLADGAVVISDKLKSVGVDTDVMADAARQRTSELQRLIADELQTRPLRALGIAAAVGIVVGLMTAR